MNRQTAVMRKDPKSGGLLNTPVPTPDFVKDKKGKSNSSDKTSHHVDFQFQAPNAQKVQLAGEFTEWEKAPLEMKADGKGTWRTRLPLQPGRYRYRFIVDGQWCDDPECHEWSPNPFGTCDAIMRVD